MLNFHDKMGALRGSQRPYYSNLEVDQMCIDELNKFSLLPLNASPIRIDRYVEKRFNISHEYEQLPSGVMGYTVFGTGGVERIVLNDSLEDTSSVTDERRLRTTLAHEVGHCLLHGHLFTSKLKKPHFAPSDIEDKAGYQGKWWEYQANMAMGSLLLPKSLFLSELRRLMGTGLLDDISTPAVTPENIVRELSNVFEVNPIVVRIRLKSIA